MRIAPAAHVLPPIVHGSLENSYLAISFFGIACLDIDFDVGVMHVFDAQYSVSSHLMELMVAIKLHQLCPDRPQTGQLYALFRRKNNTNPVESEEGICRWMSYESSYATWAAEQ